jgi:hypothetical protein
LADRISVDDCEGPPGAALFILSGLPRTDGTRRASRFQQARAQSARPITPDRSSPGDNPKMRNATYLAGLALIVLPMAALAQSTTPSTMPPDAPAAATSEAKAQAREKVRAACAADMQKFCANIERAKGAMRTCLETHQQELTDTCKAARAERSALRARDKS